MKRFINKIKDIWKVEELRKRIITTLSLVLIYRIGSFVVLPGVDSIVLAQQAESSNPSGIGALLDLFTGGAFSMASIFALGIMPYISASIIMQLLGVALPSIQKLQKEGESGRKKINNYTRWLTIIICAVQAPSYLWMSVGPAAAPLDNAFWMASSIIILISGTMFVMWLGERITDKGVGNGISLIIMIGIIARFPQSLFAEIAAKHTSGGGGYVFLLVEIVLFVLVILVTILIVQGVRKVPVQYAKKMVGQSNTNMPLQGSRDYFPVRVNGAGVMPIIFAQAIMFLPIMVGNAVESTSLVAALSDIQGFWYNLVFATMIILFTYLYTALTSNPKEIADNLKRNGAFIPGIKPGRNTADFIDSLITRITLPGSIFLALIAILPAFAMMAGITQGFAMFYGGTSLLIMVGVVLDTLQQIESYLLNRHYDGLMKSGGKIRGRESVMSTSSTGVTG